MINVSLEKPEEIENKSICYGFMAVRRYQILGLSPYFDLICTNFGLWATTGGSTQVNSVYAPCFHSHIPFTE